MVDVVDVDFSPRPRSQVAIPLATRAANTCAVATACYFQPTMATAGLEPCGRRVRMRKRWPSGATA